MADKPLTIKDRLSQVTITTDLQTYTVDFYNNYTEVFVEVCRFVFSWRGANPDVHALIQVFEHGYYNGRRKGMSEAKEKMQQALHRL